MSVGPPTWPWEGNTELQVQLMEDCILILEGGQIDITRQHVAACADWALREHMRNQRLNRKLRRIQRLIARLCSLSSTDCLHQSAQQSAAGE